MPAPSSTACLMFSMLSNSAATATSTSCRRRKRSISRRTASPRSKVTNGSRARSRGWTPRCSRCSRAMRWPGRHATSIVWSRHGITVRPRPRPGLANEIRPMSDWVAEDVSVHAVGVHVLDLDCRVRRQPVEAVDVLAQVVQPNGVDRRHPDRVPGRLLAPPHRVLQLVIALDELLAALKEQLALRRQPPRPHGAVDELRAQAVLDLPYSLAGRRLAHRVGCRGPRKALVPDNVAENAERLKVHGAAYCITPKLIGRTWGIRETNTEGRAENAP